MTFSRGRGLPARPRARVRSAPSSVVVLAAALPLLLLLSLPVSEVSRSHPVVVVDAYAIHDVHRRDICGVWRLTSKRSFLPKLLDDGGSELEAIMRRRPMKEFTVYPKKKKSKLLVNEEEEEVLLMLSEDGSFVQYGSASSVADEEEDDEEEEEKPRPKFGIIRKKDEGKEKKEAAGTKDQRGVMGGLMGLDSMRGTWDFLDGRLILAADRPEDVRDIRNVRDTMLVGDLVVKEEESLADNPAVPGSKGGAATATGEGEEEKEEPTPPPPPIAPQSREGPGAKEGGTTGSASGGGGGGGADAPSSPSAPSGGDVRRHQPQRQQGQEQGGGVDATDVTDVRLSVPRGSVEIGRFTYPKSHPSFFEQTMFKSIHTGSFQLRQVLGTLNTRTGKEKGEEIVKFTPEDLMGKRYFLTSFPLRNGRRRGKRRWSIKYNKFVEDVKQKSEEEKKREESMPIPIRTMEIELFPNMTFSTFAGFGSAKILRGKWNVIGYDKDQLWMQIWRFGFGRSVSGSTYSEGMGLTKDDEKAYWGRIIEVVPKKKDDHDDNGGDGTADHETEHMMKQKEEAEDGDEEERKAKTVEVNGSVLDGWGLEPEPVARFTMIEKTDDDDDDDFYDDDDDDDDYDYYGGGIVGGRLSLESRLDGGDTVRKDTEEDDGDDMFSSSDAFQ